jgi:hypothetical protein
MSYVNILWSIGFMAIGIVSVVVLPIIVVIFFVGVAGLIARLGRCKMSRELSPRLRRLSLEETTYRIARGGRDGQTILDQTINHLQGAGV